MYSTNRNFLQGNSIKICRSFFKGLFINSFLGLCTLFWNFLKIVHFRQLVRNCNLKRNTFNFIVAPRVSFGRVQKSVASRVEWTRLDNEKLHESDFFRDSVSTSRTKTSKRQAIFGLHKYIHNMRKSDQSLTSRQVWKTLNPSHVLKKGFDRIDLINQYKKACGRISAENAEWSSRRNK